MLHSTKIMHEAVIHTQMKMPINLARGLFCGMGEEEEEEEKKEEGVRFPFRWWVLLFLDTATLLTCSCGTPW